MEANAIIPGLIAPVIPTAHTNLAPPPGTGTFTTIELLIQAVNDHVDSQGYAVVILRTIGHKRLGYKYKYYLHCDREGKEKKGVEKRVKRRDTSSIKIEYPWVTEDLLYSLYVASPTNLLFLME